MTKMELLYRSEGETIEKFDQLDRSDHVSYQATLTFFIGTITYMVVFAGAVAAAFSLFMINLTDLVISILVFGGIAGYLGFIYIALRLSQSRSIRRYNEGSRVSKQMAEYWETLGDLYEHDALS